MFRSISNKSQFDISGELARSPAPFPRQRSVKRLVSKIGLPTFITGLLALLSTNNNSPLQIFLAFLLLLIPWSSFQEWNTQKFFGIPLFALIAGFHWLYFAVALFVGDRIAPVWYTHSLLVSEDSITIALFMAVVGITVLWLGMRVPLARILPRLPQFSIRPTDNRWDYIRWLLIFGTILSLFPNIVYVFGEEGRQLVIAFQNTMPMLAALILLKRYFEGQANHLDKVLLLIYITVRITVGLGSGWSGSVFFFGIALGLMYYLQKRRFPTFMLLFFVLFSLFIQPNKGEFRAKFWYSDERQADVIARVTFWLEESLNSWVEAFNDPTGKQLNAYLRYSILRVSLLNHAANVHDKTPEIVPYQGLSLYQFAVAGLIPRFLWPGKPSANDANRFFQVAYDVTPEDRLGDVSIAIGFLTEAYIGFGWLGVVIIMFIVGMIYSVIQVVFFSNLQNPILPAIGIVVLLRLFDIESQFGRYMIGIVQTIIYCYIFLIPLALSRRFANDSASDKYDSVTSNWPSS